MSRRKIFSISEIIIFIFLFINIFLPFMGDDYESLSLWDYSEIAYDGGDLAFKIILIGELVIGIIICTLQVLGVLKDFKSAYFSLGYYFTFYLFMLFNLVGNETFDYARLGMFIGIILSLIGIAVVGVGNFMSNETNPKMYGNSQKGNPPIGYDPKTGRPIYASVINNQPVGYDQNLGRPIYR